MSIAATLTDKLQAAFSPDRLIVLDESANHAGHHHVVHGETEEFDGAGESHLRIRIVASAFAGLSRLERHRAVNAIAEPEIKAGLHALAIEASAPGEAIRW